MSFFRSLRTALYKLPIKWPGSDQHDELQTSAWQLVEHVTQLTAEFDDREEALNTVVAHYRKENAWLLVALTKVIPPRPPN